MHMYVDTLVYYIYTVDSYRSITLAHTTDIGTEHLDQHNNEPLYMYVHVHVYM